MGNSMDLNEFKDFCGNIKKVILSSGWDAVNTKINKLDMYLEFEEILVSQSRRMITLKNKESTITINCVESVGISELPFGENVAEIGYMSTRCKIDRIKIILIHSKKGT